MACPGNETRDSSTTQTENDASAKEEVSLKKSASNTLAVMYQKNGAGTCKVLQIFDEYDDMLS